MSPDRPLLGFFFIIAFCIFAPISDALAKVVGVAAPLMVLLLARFVIQAALLLPIVAITGRPFKMTKRVFWLVTLRGVFHILGMGAMFASLRLLPLADAIAIVFVFPFILLFLGHFILGEDVGRHRIIACLIGFSGTLLVIKPSFAEIGIAALLPLLVAVAFSLFMLITRSLTKDYDPVSLQAAGGIASTLILLAVWSVVGNDFAYDLAIIAPQSMTIAWLLVGVGVLGTAAHLFMTIALRFAPSATLAPIQYLEIPVATFMGWLFFHELPDGLAAIGIMITILAGIFILISERQKTNSPPATCTSAPATPTSD